MASISVLEPTTKRFNKVKAEYVKYRKSWKIGHDEFLNHCMDLVIQEIKGGDNK